MKIKDENMMKKLIILFMVASAFWCCDPEQNVINTGVSDPRFEGSMMEYLRANDRNWDLTVQMIERAGLTELFEGLVDTLPEVTFFAPPAYSILRFMLETEEKPIGGMIFKCINDIPVDSCKRYILKHVVKGKHLKESLTFKNKDYYIYDKEQDGGTDLICLDGNHLRAYLEKENWQGVFEAGPIKMFLYSFTAGRMIPLATPDIQPSNGVVHALNYEYDFGKI